MALKSNSNPNKSTSNVDTFSSRLARESILNESNFGADTSKSTETVPAQAHRAFRLRLWHYVLIVGGLVVLSLFGWWAQRTLFRPEPQGILSASKFNTTSLDVGSLKPAQAPSTTNQVIVNGSTNISGNVIASSFKGNGQDLTNLDANNITLGKLNDARLSSNVALLNATQTFAGKNTFSGALTLPTSVTFGVLQYNFPATQSGGTLTNDGNGNLTWASTTTTPGGPSAGNCTQCINNGGDSFGAPIVIGTNDLFSSGIKTNGITRLTISPTGSSVFGGSVTASSFSGDGANLSNLNATELTTGTLSNARLSASVTTQGNTFNGIDQLVMLNSLGYLPAVNGGNLTSLNASNVTSGVLLDARLSTNVALLDSNQTFTGSKSFTQPVVVNTLTPTAAMTIGATNQSLTLRGNGSSALISTNAGGTVAVNFNGVSTGAVVYQFDAAATPGTYTICTTAGGVCGGGGGGTVSSAGGSVNRIAKFTGSQAVNDSSITDTGSVVSIAAAQLRVNGAAGGYAIDAVGDINTSQYLRVGGNIVCDSTGCATGSGGGSAILNTTSQQSAANFFIQSAGAANITGVIKAITSQSADLLQFQDASGTPIAQVYSNGSINTNGLYYVGGVQIASANLSDSTNIAKLNADQTFSGNDIFSANFISRRSANSLTAFRVQASSSADILVVDSINQRVAIGATGANYPLDVTGDINSSTGLRVGGNLVCDSSGCASSGSSGFYIQNGVSAQTNANFNIQTVDINNVVGVLQGKVGQVADLFQVKDGAGANVFKVNNVGLTTINNGITFTGGNQTIQNNTGGLNVVSNSTTLAINNTTVFTSGDGTGIRYATDYSYQPLSLVTRTYVDNAISGVVAGTCPTCFLNGGNSFGSTASIGTNDNNILNIETANTTRIRLGTDASVAFSGSTASNSYAVSMGGGTASGFASFAGGELTTASSQDAFAWGYQAQATTGNAAVALGYNTLASNNYATATGLNTIASGQSSFVANINNTASGEGAFAIGYLNTGSGVISFVGGEGSQAVARDSFAFGNNVRANNLSGSNSTAFGINTVANNNYSFVSGNASTSTGSASAAFNTADASGDNSFAVGNGQASGAYSFAGYDGTSSGSGSIAFGNSTHAYSSFSIAFGNSTKANETVGVEAFAWGRNTAANHNFATAWGNATQATGDTSTASGVGSVASGYYSFAANASAASGIGAFSINNATASGTYAFAAGEGLTNASGRSSAAFGNGTIASGIESVAFGRNTTASGNFSFASGIGSLASADQAFAANNSTASGLSAFSIGAGIASGNTSFAQGAGHAYGTYSVAFGNSTKANETVGVEAFAWGHSTVANNNYATASGENTQATGQSATASGAGSVASGYYSFAANASAASGIGAFSINNATASGTYAFAGGEGGTNASGRSSAAFGNGTTASGIESVAFGRSTTASGNFSFASGYLTTASTDEATAIGSGSVASGLYSFAGNASVASNTGAFAINNSTASGIYSFAGGESSRAYARRSFAFGSNAKANETSGENAMAWGINTVANGDYASAFGNGSTTNAAAAFAIGTGHANGAYSFAGYNSTTSALGTGAFAFGSVNTASAQFTTVFGQNNTASGDTSTAFGHDITVSGSHSFGISLNTGATTVSDNFTMAIMNGYVGINTVSPSSFGSIMAVNGSGTTYGATFYNTGGAIRARAGDNASGTLISFERGDGTNVGSITHNGSNTAYNTSSDARLKHDITDTSLSLDTVLKLQIHDFAYNSDPTNTKYTGFIAQELQKLFPEAVSVMDPKTGFLGVDYGKLTPLLAKGIQDLNTKVDGLQAQVDSLKNPQTATSIDVLAELAKAKAITLNGDLTINGNVVVFGTLELKGDNKGTIKIPAGQTTAHLSFKKNFSDTPSVTATPKNLTKASYAVQNESATGFDIVIDTAQPDDTLFNYQAL